MKLFIASIFFTFLSLLSTGQIISDIGFRLGGGISNQQFTYFWEYQTEYSGWKESKATPQVQIHCSLKINNWFSFRPSIGYIQKGYIDTKNPIITPGSYMIGYIQEDYVKDITDHYLNIDIPVKIHPFNMKINPYLVIGFRNEFLIGKTMHFEFRDQEIEENLFESTQNNKYLLSSIFTLGLELPFNLFIEFEKNLPISNVHMSDVYQIRNSFSSLSIGWCHRF